jgi:hypothetical protein
MRQLIKTVPGPPLDPNWNRARAILWHQSDSGDMNRMEDLWTAYIRDLTQCQALSEDERKNRHGFGVSAPGRRIRLVGQHRGSKKR